MALGPLSAREKQIAEHNYVAPHSHATATVTQAGFMQASDKSKLDDVAPNATNNPTANQAQAEAGTSNVVFMTPFRTEQHMLANALGWGQTLQTSLVRELGVTYVNNTGRPIFIDVMVTASAGSPARIEQFKTGVGWETVSGYGVTSGNVSMTTLVPNGVSYRARGASIVGWTEAR